MSAPYDRPAYGEPGGCECFECGVIFIGAPWHTACAACAAIADQSPKGRDAKRLDAKHASGGGEANRHETTERTDHA